MDVCETPAVIRRWLLLACLLGCNASSERAGPPPPVGSAAPSPGPRTGTTAAEAPKPSAAPSPSSSAAAPEALAGSWAGSYDAKKGEVHLPPKVKDKALAADDGKASSGPGSVELTIGAGGEVRGKVSGALGAGTITGHAEGSTLRASIWPDDSTSMGGTLMGERRGDVLACDLHVSGPDATVIRTATFELRRKP
jgi:hypothetical protein